MGGVTEGLRVCAAVRLGRERPSRRGVGFAGLTWSVCAGHRLPCIPNHRAVPRELGNFEAATESFQKALLLNQNHVQTLQLRGMMLYHHGSLQEALKNFKVSPPWRGCEDRAGWRE